MVGMRRNQHTPYSNTFLDNRCTPNAKCYTNNRSSIGRSKLIGYQPALQTGIQVKLQPVRVVYAMLYTTGEAGTMHLIQVSKEEEGIQGHPTLMLHLMSYVSSPQRWPLIDFVPIICSVCPGGPSLATSVRVGCMGLLAPWTSG